MKNESDFPTLRERACLILLYSRDNLLKTTFAQGKPLIVGKSKPGKAKIL